MAGQIKRLIDELIELRGGNGSKGVAHFLRAHLLMKGIDPDAYDERSPDEPSKVATLEQMIQDFGTRRR
jgi:hypothetical protein